VKKDKKTKKPRWYGPRNVNLLDLSTGKLTQLEVPPPVQPGMKEVEAFWKPVIDRVLARLKKRGWLDVAGFGHNSYCAAQDRHVVDMAARLWPKGAWCFTSHAGRLGSRFKGSKGVSMLARAADCVWTEGRPSVRGYRGLLKPGRDKLIWNSAARNRHRDNSPVLTFLRIPEDEILRGHDGLGYLSAELFPIENTERKGRFYCLSIDRGGVHGMTTRALLAPGRKGPIVTERYEALREGVQQCEAILFLQRALDAGTVGRDLAARVEKYLNHRGKAFIEGWKTGRVARDARLFALCAEVATGSARR
jgi:hypothetical protein